MAIKTNLDSGSLPAQQVEFKLPSGGVPYRDEYKDFPSTAVIEPYSFETEEILRSSISAKKKVVDILAAVVKNFPDGFDFGKMLSGDHAVIMAIARSLTYGEKYSFSVECPACEHVEKHTIKVPDELPVKTWNFAGPGDFAKHSTLTLPRCKDRIKVRWPTIGDSSEETEKQDTVGSAALVKSADKWRGRDLILSYAERIESVNNSAPDSIAEAAGYVFRLKGVDKIALEDFFVDNGCGIDPNWSIICDKCKTKYTRSVPIAADFFRRNRV